MSVAPARAKFLIYSSSAGSGKTYQLTKEYLTLALGTDDPAYFKRILAITFTNDAAGEMKARIMEALQRFAQAAPDAVPDTLLAEVAAAVGVGPATIRRRAAATFRLVLYHYADFAVSTIDSFVQRIATAFARELGLPAAFEVELDTEILLETAVATLLDQINRDPASRLLSQTVADYALNQADEGKSWSRLPEELLNFGKNLFSENVHEAVEQLGQLTLEDFRGFDATIRAKRKEMEAAFEEISDLATTRLQEAGATADDFFQGKSGIFGYVQKGTALLDPDAGPNSYVTKTLTEDKWYSGKVKTAADKARVDGLTEPLRTLAAQIEYLRDQLVGPYTLLAAMQPRLFHASLLSELNKVVERISRDRNLVLISEFNRRIAEVVLHEPVPFLYERLGDKYEHLLIDEFQDTSELQWNNLLPLVENTLVNGHDSLAVGDAKQAIYRWRGGEMEQILRLHQGQTDKLVARARTPEMQDILAPRYQVIGQYLQPKNLNQNFRSARAIVEFNNRLFAHISQRHAAMGLVTSIYNADFGQQTPGEPAAGHVEIIFTQPDAPAQPYQPATGDYAPAPLPGYLPGATLGYDESTAFLTLALVEQALADGFALADIAVLCRTRKASKLLAKFLKERGYPIISADSLALEFAEVVNLLVAVFRVLHQPADTLGRAEALFLFDKVVRGEVAAPARARHLAEVAKRTDGKSFFDELRAHGHDVQEAETGNLGLYELAERLINLFGLLGRNGESDYLFRFLDYVLDYSLRQGNNLGQFLAEWAQRKGRLSINAPGGRPAITITTVHKAKGLAYGVVIVPFADWTLEPYRGTLLWGRLPTAARPLPELPVAVVPLSKKLQGTALAAQYDEEQEKTFLEGLNTLYVALTRPRHRLYLLSKRPNERKTTKADPLAPAAAPTAPARTVADLLHGFLLAENQWDAERMAFVLDQGVTASEKTKNQEPTTKNYELTNLGAVPWEDRLRLRRHARNVFDFDEQQRLNEWNRRLHYALRRLHAAADVPRVAAQLVAEGLIGNPERAALEKALHAVVVHPQLAPYFAPGLSVETERDLLVGGVPLRDYKPDRVVFDRSGQRVTLLDFKLPPPHESHARQLRTYARQFEALGYADVRGLIYYFGTGTVVAA